MEDDEYQKLPIEDKCVHKLWKARVNGYEEVTKLFRQIDEKSPEFQKYLGLVKKFVIDSNAMGQEKGLEAALAFVENYAHAGKTVGEVMSGIVTKCMAAPKTRTRELALQITLMYIEIEKHEIVEEELIKGMDLKNPKIVSACINACTTALREFGSKVITVKPLVKKISVLFSDRDKTVRDEARAMVIEMYRWIGPALRSQLTNLQPVQVTELEAEFSKIEGQKATPTRYLRSQQEKQAKMAVEATEGDEGEVEDEEGGDAPPVDAYEISDPVDILSKLPKDFLEKIEAKKWQERKEALEVLENLVKAPKLENGDYGDVVRALKKVVQKDSNVLCIALAGKCLAGLASGLKKRFQIYASATVPALLEKFKEKKANVVTAIKEAIDAVYLTTSLETILEDVLEAFNNKNPSVKSETALFLARAFTKTQPAVLNKKLLKALTGAFIKIINESDPTVRDSAAEAIGTLMKLVGEKAIMPFLVDLEKDNLKMTKIKECCEKAVITVKITGPKKERPAAASTKSGPKIVKPQKASSATNANSKQVRRPASAISKSASNNSLDFDEPSEDAAGGDVPPPADTATRVDISPQITEALINELSDKNWKVRNEALMKVSNIITDAKLIKSNIGALTQALSLRLVDSNSKIAQTTLNICENLATAMGPSCKTHVRVLFPGFLQGLGDGKAWIRTASISCINTFGDQGGYKDFFEGEMIADALKTGSPTLRIELWNWLAEKLPKLKSIPKDELLLCIPYLYTNVEDRNADVRKNAQEAVLGFMIHLSFEGMVKQTEKLKPGAKTAVMQCLDKARPNLPVKPLPSRKQDEEKPDKVVRGTRPVATSKNAVKKAGAAAKPAPSSRKKDEDIDTSPLLVVNNMKHQRTIDESKLRVLKWNFTQPREEFVELLKEQMANANVNKTLMANMFHADFRYHIKAIESLTDDVQENGAALISNLDLILKWLTIRFFDTNPSVLLKGLEYLHCAFNMLIENKYNLLENEASAFIPYLILKIGDPKDAVRNGVRTLFNKICLVYSVSKLFSSYIMEGIKSKNARQRAECLDLMGAIIEDYGISVCLPSPGACLKEVAKQISDRDNSVRNAALNCVVQAYYIVGDKVFKMVGQISDKDMSLLEERIKRASKKPPAPKVARMETTTEVTPVNMTSASPRERDNSPAVLRNKSYSACETEDDTEETEEEMNNLPDVVLPPQVVEMKTEEPSGPFMLDPELMKELESVQCNVPKPNLLTFDLSFLNEEIKIPSITDSQAKVMPMSPPKPILPNQTFSRSSLSAQRQATPRSGQDIILEKTIGLIGSPDINIALQAIEQMQDILQSNKGNHVTEYEDQFMMAITSQLRMLSVHDPRINPSVLKTYRMILTLIDSFYANKDLGRKVSTSVLKDVMNQLIILLVEPKLEACPNGDAFIRVVNVHCVKVIDRSEHTNIVCALVNLLRDCAATNTSTRHTELVMKCLWKIIKLIPSWAEEIDYDSILLEVHLFLKEFPSSWWKTKSMDTPLRTVKTILHSMAKIKGGALMLHLGKIPNTNDSEMESYILKLLKSLKLEEVKQVPLKTDSSRQLSRSTHTQLTDIFQKIGTREETKEGLNMLYDFIQLHPEADIEPFLKKSSPFFQDYIQKNLKEIENSRKHASALSEVKTDSSTTENNAEYHNKRTEYYNERLTMWQKLWADKVKKFHE